MRRRIRKLFKKARYVPGLGRVLRPVVHRHLNRTVDKVADHFFEHFTLVLATTESQRKTCYQTRHKVYCEEMGFEPCRESRMERDPFDEYAISAYIQHRVTGDCAGTIRLIVPQQSGQLLPLEQVYDSAGIARNTERSEQERSCEISRLAIPRRFRRRESDCPFSAVAGRGDERTFKSLEPGRHFPYLSVALYFFAANVCLLRGIERVYVMMEPKLARSLKMLGIRFEQIGAAVDFHGERASYSISTAEFLNQIPPSLQRFQMRIMEYLTASYDLTTIKSLPDIPPALQNAIRAA